jgi:ATP-dependent DNA ligase
VSVDSFTVLMKLRSNTLLKVKSFEDAEAIVVGHNFSREDPAKCAFFSRVFVNKL